MGCSSAVPKNVPKNIASTYPSTKTPDFLPSPILNESDPSQVISYDLSLLLKGIDEIPVNCNLHPISCVSMFSSPLMIDPIFEILDEKIFSSWIGFSRYERGRVICIGSISLLMHCTPDNNNMVFFLEKLLRWIGGPLPVNRMLCMLNVEKTYHEMLTNNMQGLGFGIDIRETITDPMIYTIIMIPSTFNDADMLLPFVTNGGGIICYPVENDKEFRVNSLLNTLGLGFLNSATEFLSINPKTTTSLNDLSKGSFVSHIASFEKLIQLPSVPKEYVENYISLIEKEILLVSSLQHGLLLDLAESSMSYLNRTNSLEYGNICPSFCDKMVARLISKCIKLVHPAMFGGIDISHFFSGSTMNAEFDQVDISIYFNGSKWIDTGVWIPSGLVVSLLIDKTLPPCSIQIGAHVYNAFNNSGPWKRWPSIDVQYPVTDRLMEISSPFGGMLFIIPNDSSIEKPKPFKISISDASSYPIVRSDGGDSFEEGEDYGIPWGQIICKQISFIVPSNLIYNNEQNRLFCNKIDRMMKKMVDLIGLSNKEMIRVVYDEEFPHDFSVDYPITIDVSEYKDVLYSDTINQSIVHLIMSISFYVLSRLSLNKDFHRTVSLLLTDILLYEVYNTHLNESHISFSIPQAFFKLQNYLINNTRLLFEKIDQFMKNNTVNDIGLAEKLLLQLS